MANYGWAYVGNVITGSGGIGSSCSGSLQWATGPSSISGSQNLYWDHCNNSLFLTGAMFVSGTINADIINVNHHNKTITNISATGSTEFGDTSDDRHIFVGRVTIGDTQYRNPHASLHIHNSASTATIPQEMIRLTVEDEGVDMNVGGGGPSIDFYVGETSGQGFGGLIGVIREEASDVNTDAAMVFHTATDDQVRANDREKMRISSEGNVGIGTTSPASTLHLYKAATAASGLPLEMLRLQSTDEGVDVELGQGPAITFYIAETSGEDHGGTIAVVKEVASDADSAAAMVFHTAVDDTTPAERMRITSTGKVGVGVSDPDTQLEVFGTSTQQKWSYDATEYATITIGSDATTTIANDGASSPGNIVVDSAADIELNADGGQVSIKDASASHFLFDCDNTAFTIYDDTAAADYFKITVAANGATTLSTNDNDGTLGNLTLTVDGDIILGPAGGDVLPDADNTRNLGSATVRWANIYTGDLHLKNDRGDWTILEEEDYLCVINNKTGKRYKMLLQEIEA